MAAIETLFPKLPLVIALGMFWGGVIILVGYWVFWRCLWPLRRKALVNASRGAGLLITIGIFGLAFSATVLIAGLGLAQWNERAAKENIPQTALDPHVSN